MPLKRNDNSGLIRDPAGRSLESRMDAIVRKKSKADAPIDKIAAHRSARITSHKRPYRANGFVLVRALLHKSCEGFIS